MIDMRDEEDELAYLQRHSQSRHEHLHNQYNKVKEEEDQWQDVSHTEQTHTQTRLTRLICMPVYIFWLLCVGFGSLEEPEAKRFSRSDQKGGGKEDDGEANDNRWWTRTSQEEHQNIQRNCRGEVRHKWKFLYI